jgi:hypothetical protein
LREACPSLWTERFFSFAFNEKLVYSPPHWYWTAIPVLTGSIFISTDYRTRSLDWIVIKNRHTTIHSIFPLKYRLFSEKFLNGRGK